MTKHVISRVKFGRKWGHRCNRLHDQALTGYDITNLIAFDYPELIFVGHKWIDLDSGTAFKAE